MSPLRAQSPDLGEDKDAAAPEFSLRELWFTLQRRRRAIFAVAALVAAAIAVAGLTQPPKYTASTVLMVNPTPDRVVNQEQSLSDTAPSSAMVDSEVEVLRSPQLAQRLAEAQHLTDDPRWNPALRPADPLRTAIQTIKGWFVRGAGAHRQTDLSRAVSEAISVKRRGLSYVVDIDVSAPDPMQASAMANTLVQLYVDTDDEARLESGQRASDWLSDRIRELRADVQQKEAAAQQFRAQSGLLSAGGVSLTEQQVTEVQNAVLQARADLADKEARYRLVRQLAQSNGAGSDTAADVLDSQVIRDLRQREVDQSRHQAELESTLGPLHPDVQAGRAELENIHGQIRAEIARIQASAGNEVDVARTRLQALEQNLGSVRGELSQNDSEQVRAGELDREAAAARTVYESFLQRYHVIADQGNLGVRQVRVIAPARPPTSPSAPNPPLILLLAAAAGLAAGASVGLAIEAFDSGVSSAAEVERRLRVAAVASIPTIRPRALRLLAPGERHPAGYVVEKPFSAFAEAFRVLRSAVRFALPDNANRVVAITSSLPDEGKTTCSLGLARVAAMAGHSVVLLDCDRRRRSLNALLDIHPEQGLLEVLDGKCSWRSVVARDESTGMHVLPCSTSQNSARDIFSSEAMQRLLTELRQNYEFVILDCPPVLIVAETRELAANADIVFVVNRARRTQFRAVRSAISQLRRADANVAGVVLNFIDPRQPADDAYSNALYSGAVSKGYYDG